MIEEGSLIPKKGDDVQQQLKFFSEIFFSFWLLSMACLSCSRSSKQMLAT
jgi:hypothetical protein